MAALLDDLKLALTYFSSTQHPLNEGHSLLSDILQMIRTGIFLRQFRPHMIIQLIEHISLLNHLQSDSRNKLITYVALLIRLQSQSSFNSENREHLIEP